MEELGIPELQARIAAGDLTARALAEMYLQRIAEVDRDGPRLNSVIEVNPDALSIAAALDAERRERGPRGPLHGIPVLLKDNIDTADRMMTTAGSLALVGHIAPRTDAYVAARLRAAGAVILGKTNLSEWANFRSTHSVSGWSSRGGQTRNPYALDRNPCGSSSGSAVAVAANLCAVAIGTETDGSIVCPSHANGIVGIKPTLGLVSRSGDHPHRPQPGHRRPHGAHRRDAAVLLGALAGLTRDPLRFRGRATPALLENLALFREGRRSALPSPRRSGAGREVRLHPLPRPRRAAGRPDRRRPELLRLQPARRRGLRGEPGGPARRGRRARGPGEHRDRQTDR